MDQISAITLIVLAVCLMLPFVPRVLVRYPKALPWAKLLILFVYIAGNLYETILFRPVFSTVRYQLSPFWSYRKALSAGGGIEAFFRDLFAGTLTVSVTNSELLREILLNILLYVPLGYLLPWVFPSLNGRGLIAWKVIPVGFACSLLTELTQLVLRIGLCELDDLFNNTLGCLLGCILFSMVMGQHRRSRPVRALVYICFLLAAVFVVLVGHEDIRHAILKF